MELYLEFDMIQSEDKEHKEDEETRKKARKSSKSSKSRKKTPKVTEKTKKRKRKQSVVASKSSHGSENTNNRSLVIDDVQPEPKSILNISKRAKVIEFNDTKKDDRTDNFKTGRLRSNHDQYIQLTGKIK